MRAAPVHRGGHARRDARPDLYGERGLERGAALIWWIPAASSRRRTARSCCSCASRRRSPSTPADVIVFVGEIGTGVTARGSGRCRRCCKRAAKPVVLCVNKMDSVGAGRPGHLRVLRPRSGRPDRGLRRSRPRHRRPAGRVRRSTFPPEDEREEERRRHQGRRHRQAERRQILARQPHRSARSASLSPTSPAPRATPIDTAVGERIRQVSSSSTPPASRRKSKVDDAHREVFSVMRAQMAIDRADVCLIMIDAQRRASPSRTPRSPGLPTRRARPASSSSTSGTPSKKTTKHDGRDAQEVCRGPDAL